MAEEVFCFGRKRLQKQKTLHLRYNENSTILECLFCDEKFMVVLAQKVIQNTQLKQFTEDLMVLLKRDDDDDSIASAFADKVNELTNCTDFIQACSETTGTTAAFGSSLPFYVESYRIGDSAHVKMRHLRDDDFLQCILEQKEPLHITRGVLSILIGFWNNVR